MPNRYANLVGSNKIKDEWQKINDGFDKVQQEMDEKPDASIAQVNDIQLGADDTLALEGGTGITVTTVPAEKKVRITATGESTPGLHGIEHNHDGSDPIPELIQVRGDLAAHLEKTVMDPNGVHGLSIERGAFTPEIRDASNNQPSSYSYQWGYYEKFGKMAYITLMIGVSTKGSISGEINIAGLPFMAASSEGDPTKRWTLSMAGMAQMASYDYWGADVPHSANFVRISRSNAMGGAGVIQADDINNDFFVSISGIYQID